MDECFFRIPKPLFSDLSLFVGFTKSKLNCNSFFLSSSNISILFLYESNKFSIGKLLYERKSGLIWLIASAKFKPAGAPLIMLKCPGSKLMLFLRRPDFGELSGLSISSLSVLFRLSSISSSLWSNSFGAEAITLKSEIHIATIDENSEISTVKS